MGGLHRGPGRRVCGHGCEAECSIPQRDSDELAITSILSTGDQKWMQRLDSLVTVAPKGPKKSNSLYLKNRQGNLQHVPACGGDIARKIRTTLLALARWRPRPDRPGDPGFVTYRLGSSVCQHAPRCYQPGRADPDPPTPHRASAGPNGAGMQLCTPSRPKFDASPTLQNGVG